MAVAPSAVDPVGLELEAAIQVKVSQDAVKIPPYPAVAVKLQQILDREDYELPEVVAVVSSDPAIAAVVLRCANSALFGRGNVTALQQAVLRIGVLEVARLSLAASLSGAAATAGPLQSLRRKVWHSSVASAVVCQVLAKGRGLKVEDAFVSGLLHDFGWLVGLAGLEEELARRPAFGARPEAFWSQILYRIHLKIGQQIALRWKLPDLFREVMSLHHAQPVAPGAPPVPESPFQKYVKLVQTSDQIVPLLFEHPSVTEIELLDVEDLAPEERKLLAANLPEVPTVLSAFEAQPKGPAQPSKVETPAPLPEGFRPLTAQVNQMRPTQKGTWTLCGISSMGWLMRGKDALPENQLFEAQILTDPHLRVWAKATASKPEAGGFLLECKPFALSGPTRDVWNVLFRKASAPTSG
jgi:HD-like signal output (HDOD) protein